MKNNMLRAVSLAAVLLLAACERPAPFESVESLVGNPDRLKELRAQCKADRAKVGDAQCNAVAEATRKRFHGSGTPYTPGPEIELFRPPADKAKKD